MDVHPLKMVLIGIDPYPDGFIDDITHYGYITWIYK